MFHDVIAVPAPVQGVPGHTLAILLMLGFVLKHFICDFPLQGPYQWMNKGRYLHPGGILHAAIAVLGSLTVLFTLTLFGLLPKWDDWWLLTSMILGGEFLIHYHCDWAKVNINNYFGLGPNTHATFWHLLGFDQLVHYLTYLWMAWMICG